MRLPRLARPLLLTSALTLSLAACSGSNSGEPSASTTSSTAPAATVAAAPGFSADNAIVKPTPLPVNSEDALQLSPDGTRIATLTVSGSTATITEHDLVTGKVITYPALSGLLGAPDASPLASLRYAGDQLIVLTAGTVSGSGVNADTEQWKLAAYPAKTPGQPQVFTGQGDARFAQLTHGAILNINDTISAVNLSTGELTATAPDQELPGCGSAGCSVDVVPAVQAAGELVSTYTERRPGTAQCSSTPGAPGHGCLHGFRTASWTSADPGIAPDGAVPTYARIYSTNGEYLVGEWASLSGGSIFRLIDPDSPQAAHGTWTCNTILEPGMAHMAFSPSRQYLAVGSTITNLQSGACFDQGQADTKPAVLTAVDDTGKAWGALVEDQDVNKDLPWKPSPTGITVPVQSPAGSQNLPASPAISLPVQVLDTARGPAGVFIDQNGAHGQPAVAVYPLG